jgi:hypothetical protein
MKKLFTLAVCMAAYLSSCWAQSITPTQGVQYQVLNSVGMALARSGDNCVLKTPDKADKNQTWVFEHSTDPGTYNIKNVGTDSYLYLYSTTSWDTWDMSFTSTLPADIGRAEYTFESLTDPYCGIKLACNSKYLGADGVTEGAWVYGDKQPDANGYWQLVMLSTGSDALDALIADVQKYESNDLMNYPGLTGELDDVLLQFGTPENTDSASIKACMDTINAAWDKVKQGLADATQLTKLLTRAEKLIASTTYPGMEAFQAAYDEASEAAQDQQKLSAEYAAALAKFTAAIRTYRLSQNASADTPADYTFMIQHPWFCNDDNVPASNSQDDINAAGQTANTANGTGWVNGCTYNNTWGDVHASYRQSRDCWNAWATNFNNYLDVHQDITDLPDGYYGVTCDAITQLGCLSDQHVYIVSSIQSAADSLTTEGWVGDDATGLGTWEALNTASNAKVLVRDGKLSIGFRGTHDASKVSDAASDGRNGWFCVSNFKLQYYGKATLEQITEFYKNTLAACQAQADTMLFKGDKANYQKVLTAFGSAADEVSIGLALDTLSKASALAATSVAKQRLFLSGPYKAIQDSLAAGVYTDATLIDMLQTAVKNAGTFINAEGQTYTCADSVANSLNAYINSYTPEYLKAQNAVNAFTQQSSKDIINATIADQIKELKSGILSSTLVAGFIDQIEVALREAATNETLAAGETDYTAAIANPACDAADRNILSGWSVQRSKDASANNVGQQYDGNTQGHYLDSWNPTPKALLFNAHQTITNLPNGTYTLQAMCRTDGAPSNEGTYLYTIADNDSLNGIQLAMVKREQCNITTATQGQFKAADGTDSLLYVSDSYGSIWEASAAATNYGTSGSELDLSIFQSHTNIGYGWHYVSVPAVVKNHILVIGFTNDSTFTVGHNDIEGKPCVPYTGTWLSADNFTLTLTATGDNTNWSPVTAITDARVAGTPKVSIVNGRIISDTPCRIYNMSGQQMNGRDRLSRGCYIVKTGNSAVKVIVK